MSKVLDIIKSSVILLLITSIAAAMLAFVNGKTAPLIEKNTKEKQAQSLMAVASDAVEMQEAEITDVMEETASKYSAELNSIYKSVNSIGELAGYCAVVTVNGYDSGLQMAVGVDYDGKVSGVEIIASNETPGLGQNASKPEFKEQFKGKQPEIEVVKSDASDNQINALSGATITSNAVVRGVNTVLEISNTLLEEVKGE